MAEPHHRRGLLRLPFLRALETHLLGIARERRGDAAPRSQRGRVYDEQGAPIAGATVAQLRSVLHPWVGFFSAEALRPLAAGWSATTDEEGAWALPVSSRERIPCIVSKQGRTPVVFDLTESRPPPHVVLQT